ncbi:MAG TPA: DNA recombination protein RmuC [bacterium]|nr:DNA recombination protein RmuC [bacterium]
MGILFLIIGVIVGAAWTFIFTNLNTKLKFVKKEDFETLQKNKNEIDNELNKSIEQLKILKETLNKFEVDNANKTEELKKLIADNSSKSADLENFKSYKQELQLEIENLKKEYTELSENLKNTNQYCAEYKAKYEQTDLQLKEVKEKNLELQRQINDKNEDLKNLNSELSKVLEINKTLQEKLEFQKKEIDEIKQQFKIEFQNIANKILEEKSSKFTELNKTNLENLLKPLGENIENFRKKVDEVYNAETRERGILAEKIKNLMELTNKVSAEANNLTQALKTDIKRVGNWGEMILESILENSGLTKNREYFIQEYLKQDGGAYLMSEDGKKMQPDVIIKCPEDRCILIDSKVSLNAYNDYHSANDAEQQAEALKRHIEAIKKHIDDLSGKNYEDYQKSLDFVLMFVPIEAAYLLAVQNNPQLWNYAYSKRIILIGPTNLIAVLKLIENLWKKEYQNKNVLEIAKRGEILYEKFVGFVESLEEIGKNINKTLEVYNKAVKQLNSGKGNLISQAKNLKELGLKPKKELPEKFLMAEDEDIENLEETYGIN